MVHELGWPASMVAGAAILAAPLVAEEPTTIIDAIACLGSIETAKLQKQSLSPSDIKLCEESAETEDYYWLLLDLGVEYQTGRVLPKDHQKALEMFRRGVEAAEKNEFPKAALGRYYYYIGALYYQGDGISQKLDQAVLWLERAEESAEADYGLLLDLGVEYQTGRVLPKDPQKALELFRRGVEAAEQNEFPKVGLGIYYYQIGALYYRGDGIAQDLDQAVLWLERAADQNIPDAQALLARLYGLGKGVRQDLVEAFKWGSLAAANDNKYAQARDLMASVLSVEQIAESHRRIQTWRDLHADSIEFQKNLTASLAENNFDEISSKSESRHDLIARDEVSVQQAADIFEQGCVGASQSIDKTVGGKGAKIAEAVKECLLGSADSIERDLKEADVSPALRTKYETLVTELRSRANNH